MLKADNLNPTPITVDGIAKNQKWDIKVKSSRHANLEE